MNIQVTSRGLLILILCLVSCLMVSSCQTSAATSAARLYIQQDDWASAERILQDEIALRPKNAEAWFLLGTIAKHDGIYTRAVYRFEEAARIDSALKVKCQREIDTIPSEIDSSRGY